MAIVVLFLSTVALTATLSLLRSGPVDSDMKFADQNTTDSSGLMASDKFAQIPASMRLLNELLALPSPTLWWFFFIWFTLHVYGKLRRELHYTLNRDIASLYRFLTRKESVKSEEKRKLEINQAGHISRLRDEVVQYKQRVRKLEDDRRSELLQGQIWKTKMEEYEKKYYSLTKENYEELERLDCRIRDLIDVIERERACALCTAKRPGGRPEYYGEDETEASSPGSDSGCDSARHNFGDQSEEAKSEYTTANALKEKKAVKHRGGDWGGKAPSLSSPCHWHAGTRTPEEALSVLSGITVERSGRSDESDEVGYQTASEAA